MEDQGLMAIASKPGLSRAVGWQVDGPARAASVGCDHPRSHPSARLEAADRQAHVRRRRERPDEQLHSPRPHRCRHGRLLWQLVLPQPADEPRHRRQAAEREARVWRRRVPSQHQGEVWDAHSGRAVGPVVPSAALRGHRGGEPECARGAGTVASGARAAAAAQGLRHTSRVGHSVITGFSHRLRPNLFPLQCSQGLSPKPNRNPENLHRRTLCPRRPPAYRADRGCQTSQGSR